MHAALYCIVLYCIVLYCIVLYCIVLYCIVLYCIVLYCIVLYCIVLYCIVLYCIVLYTIALLCTVLYCIVFYCRPCFSETGISTETVSGVKVSLQSRYKCFTKFINVSLNHQRFAIVRSAAPFSRCQCYSKIRWSTRI